jgi:hypothetical protein
MAAQVISRSPKLHERRQNSTSATGRTRGRVFRFASSSGKRQRCWHLVGVRSYLAAEPS